MSPQTHDEQEIMARLKDASMDLAWRWADEMHYEDPMEYQLLFRKRLSAALPEASLCRLTLGRTKVLAKVKIHGRDYSIQYNL